MRALESRLPDAVPASLLLVVEIALLVNPAVPGVHVGEGEVTRYEAARVSYDDADGLRIVDVSSGEPRELVDVDDDIGCEELGGRVCQFERAVLDGTDIGGPDPFLTEAQYTYVYFNDTLYGQTATDGPNGTTAALEPVTDDDPLGRIALTGDYSPSVRRAIDGETVLVYGELSVENQLIEHEGAYYTVLPTAGKRYGGGGSFCASSGEGFCEAADAKRTTDTLLTLGSRLLGGLLLLAGYTRRGPD
ncbi:hypothetical protein [Halobaculum gomorrense]|uniref:Uncharacterized protein n=1 Tax=Halobaculum gomorrense TaxID=43928 RepID=A0A1M5PDS1_9EURY|nr:hypothetical protein [Halobaculum gomorrense]SHG99920.1 hypothetical protein SAMN05443636_1561 [Halobaculum gomorrense]